MACRLLSLRRSTCLLNKIVPLSSRDATLRHFSSTSVAFKYPVTFTDLDGAKHTFEAEEGESLLDLAQRNNLEVEGACEGACACSTCHVIVDEEYFDKLPPASEEELDMLDMALNPTDFSRLGCQVCMNEKLAGIQVVLPEVENLFEE